MSSDRKNAEVAENLLDGRNEDVEFSVEAADENDLEALARAKAADRRAAERQ